MFLFINKTYALYISTYKENGNIEVRPGDGPHKLGFEQGWSLDKAGWRSQSLFWVPI
jgi:hypothetical protein